MRHESTMSKSVHPSERAELRLADMPDDYAAWYGTLRDKVSAAASAMQALAITALPPVTARLVRDATLGADARAVAAGYEVRIHAALPTVLHFAFNNLLRTPYFMPGVGDPSTERPYNEEGIERIPLSLPRRLPIEEAIVWITGLSRPADQRRAGAAVLLTELAVAFCSHHELAHVALGHVAANDELNGTTKLLEVGPRRAVEGLSRDRVALRHVWEYEADMVAANMLLQDMMDARAHTAFKDALGEEADCGPLARYQGMLSAAFVVFLLFAQVPSTGKTHPDPLVRFAAVANDSAAALAEQQPQLQLSIEEAAEGVDAASRMTLASWMSLGLQTSVSSPVRTMLTAQRRIERIKAQQARLGEAHRRHAYFYPFRP